MSIYVSTKKLINYTPFLFIMNVDEQHAADWAHVKEYNEGMLKSTGDHKYEVRISACDRLLATIK